MINKVKENLYKYNMIQEHDTVIAGISGGADSVCMLINLLEYKKTVEYDLKVVHINHKIREEAGQDAEFVKNLCDKYGLEYLYFEDKVEEIAKENGLSCEEAGRIVRYGHFREVAGDKGKIAVAHNRNDVAETVLFNIFRGTGIEGLSSLGPVNDHIIRPLINVSRQEIEEYLKKNETGYCTDCTNATDDYARNKIRNRILPYVEENLVKNATEHVAELSEKMQKIKCFIKETAAAAFDECVTMEAEKAKINIEKMQTYNEVIIDEILLLVLEKLTPQRKDITSAHLEAVKNLLGKNGEKRVSLPYSLEAVKSYSELQIRKCINDFKGIEPVKLQEGQYRLADGREISVSLFARNDKLTIPQKTYTKWFDYDKISTCIILRNRQSKDYLTVNKANGKKSLKDYFIDEKIPKEERDYLPVIADGSHILWVIDYRISEYYKVTEETKTIIEIAVK